MSNNMEVETGWALFSGSVLGTADMNNNNDNETTVNSFSAAPFSPDKKAIAYSAGSPGNEQTPIPDSSTTRDAATSTSITAKSPTSRRRESIQDKVKRRSILEGLSSFQISGASSEDLSSKGSSSSSTSSSEDESNQDHVDDDDDDDDDDERETSMKSLDLQQLNEKVEDDDMPSAKVKLGYESSPVRHKSKTNDIQHSDVKYRKEQQRHDCRTIHQNQNKRTSSQQESPHQQLIDIFSSSVNNKSVRFQFDDNQIIKAGELSSHAKDHRSTYDSVAEIQDLKVSGDSGAVTSTNMSHESGKTKIKLNKGRTANKKERDYSTDSDSGQERRKLERQSPKNKSKSSPKATRSKKNGDQQQQQNRLHRSLGNISMDTSSKPHEQGSGNMQLEKTMQSIVRHDCHHSLDQSEALVCGDKKPRRHVEEGEKFVIVKCKPTVDSSVTTEITLSTTTESKSDVSSRKSPLAPQRKAPDGILLGRDRRKLLRKKTSSLSDLELVDKERGETRRQDKFDRKHRYHSSKQMNQSLRSFDDEEQKTWDSKSRKAGADRKRESSRHIRQDSSQHVDDSFDLSLSFSNERKNNDSSLVRGLSKSSLAASEVSRESGGGRGRNSKARNRLHMHKSLGNIVSLPAGLPENTRSSTQSNKRSAATTRVSRSEHGKCTSQAHSALPLVTSRQVYPSYPDSLKKKQTCSTTLGTDIDELGYRKDYHSRMMNHQSLQQTRSSESSPPSRKDSKSLFIESSGNLVNDGSSRSLQQQRSKSRLVGSPQNINKYTSFDKHPHDSTTALRGLNGRKLLHNHSSMTDPVASLESYKADAASGTLPSSERWRLHKSLRDVAGEPVPPAKTTKQGDRGRRTKSTEQGYIADQNGNERATTRATFKETSCRRARSLSKSHHSRRSSYSREPSQSSRSQSKSRARSRSKHNAKRLGGENDRARSRSRHNKRRAEEGNDRTRSRSRHNRKLREGKHNQVIEQEEATLDIVPKHVFVGEGFEGRMGGSSDEACLSSIEGVSVELDRKKEERKRAKQEAALGAVLNASLGELELRPCDKSAEDQRLNQSMSSVLKRPTLLRSDSGVSSLSFPPSDRRKRASKSQHSVEDHDLRIPDAIAIRCKPQDFTSLPQLRPHCISAVGGHCLDIVKSEFHSENTTEDDRRTPRWMNRLSIHSVLNTISREEVTEMKI